MPEFHGSDCPACDAALAIIPALADYLGTDRAWDGLDDDGVLIHQRLAEITASILHSYPLGRTRAVRQSIGTVGPGSTVIGAVISERRERR